MCSERSLLADSNPLAMLYVRRQLTTLVKVIDTGHCMTGCNGTTKSQSAMEKIALGGVAATGRRILKAGVEGSLLTGGCSTKRSVNEG